MRAFITGATGFAGSHLVDHLLDNGYDVAALVHAASSHQELPDAPGVRPYPGDLLDLASLTAAVADAAPDVIFHLAGQAYPARSWGDPARTIAINTGGTANLLEAAVALGRPRVVVVTSAEMYGALDAADLPLTETAVPRPRHPYGVSKMAAGELVRVYHDRYGLPVVEARPFNHIGPRQAPGFVVPDFASQLAAVGLGLGAAEMRVGNLDAQRDFTDVRDVVRAYRLLAEGGEPGQAYLICSGRPVAIRDLLDEMLDLLGQPVAVTLDPARLKPSDTPCIYGSYAKLAARTDWAPAIPLRQSLADALADWTARLASPSA
jgi:GDP-4-dehydro-6-deoxy-D-mannose reductase